MNFEFIAAHAHRYAAVPDHNHDHDHHVLNLSRDMSGTGLGRPRYVTAMRRLLKQFIINIVEPAATTREQGDAILNRTDPFFLFDPETVALPPPTRTTAVFSGLGRVVHELRMQRASRFSVEDDERRLRSISVLVAPVAMGVVRAVCRALSNGPAFTLTVLGTATAAMRDLGVNDGVTPLALFLIDERGLPGRRPTRRFDVVFEVADHRRAHVCLSDVLPACADGVYVAATLHRSMFSFESAALGVLHPGLRADDPLLPSMRWIPSTDDPAADYAIRWFWRPPRLSSKKESNPIGEEGDDSDWDDRMSDDSDDSDGIRGRWMRSASPELDF